MYEIYLGMKEGQLCGKGPAVLADSEGLLCYPGQHPSGNCTQPWLSEQGEVSARNVYCELIACAAAPFSSSSSPHR